MSGIIWLASYPKSGNTWMRAFLANLFINDPQPININDLPNFAYGDARADLYEAASGKPLEELSDADIHRLRPAVARMIAAARPDAVFAKTHNAVAQFDGTPTIPPDSTAGAIYVVRNPLDTAISYAHHFGMEPDQAIEAMNSEINQIVTLGRSAFQFLGSWHSHVESWLDAPGLSPHLVRYEDMLRDPLKAFGGVVKYLKLPREPARLKQAIRFSSFKVLSEQEQRDGFRERSKINDRFFRAGRAGGWRESLSEEQVQRVIAYQGKVMRRLGYLTADGKLRC